MIRSSLVTWIVRGASLVVIGAAVTAIAYAIASAPTREPSRLGLRGLKRQRVLRDNELWASVEPFVRWLGVRLSRISTDEQRAAIDRQIALAGDFLGITADEFVALSVLSTAAGAAAGYAVGELLEIPQLPVAIGAVLGGALPYLQVASTGADRLKDVSRGLPYVIDLMALSMSAGLDFPAAVREVIEKSSNPNDPLVEELTLVLQTLNLGRSRREALLELARRIPTDTVTEFVNALVQAEERGNPVAEVLAIQATISRTRRSARAEEAAAKASVAMVGPLMLVFLAVMGLLLGPAMLSISTGL